MGGGDLQPSAAGGGGKTYGVWCGGGRFGGKWVGLSGNLEFFGDVGAGRGPDGQRDNRRCSRSAGVGGGGTNGVVWGREIWGEMDFGGLSLSGKLILRPAVGEWSSALVAALFVDGETHGVVREEGRFWGEMSKWFFGGNNMSKRAEEAV
ncbi:hypothetical protein SLA2020_424370 [Shorea laevis]